MAESTEFNAEQEDGKTIRASHSKCVRKNGGFENVLKEEPRLDGSAFAHPQLKMWEIVLCVPKIYSVITS